MSLFTHQLCGQSSAGTFKRLCFLSTLLPFWVLLLTAPFARGQSFALDDLIDLAELPREKFVSTVMKKGFRTAEHGSNPSLRFALYEKKGAEKMPVKWMGKLPGTALVYNTVSFEECFGIKEQLKRSGYSYPATEEYKSAGPLLFQKGEIQVVFTQQTEDSVISYTMQVKKNSLPRARNVQYAEDLLALDAHECLAAVFGERNVRKDVFFLSETETRKCSVLFPNTTREAVFIWEDEGNYRGIMAIRIGGDPQTAGSRKYDGPVLQNAWRSRGGIYSGMSLRELQLRNGQPVLLTDPGRSRDGVCVLKNNGRIDFSEIGLLLNCLNCGDDKYFTASLESAADALGDRRIYISTMLLYPRTDKAEVAAK